MLSNYHIIISPKAQISNNSPKVAAQLRSSEMHFIDSLI